MAVATLLLASNARPQEISSLPSLQIVSSPPGDDAQAGPSEDGQEPAKVKAKKTKKKTKNKNAGDDTTEEKVKPPKHPSWSPIPAIKLDFKARIETEMRGSTPASGFEHGQIDWQDRRIGVEGTAFKRITFELSHELSDDFEAAHDLSQKSAWKDAWVNYRVNKALNVEGGRFKLPFGREELTGETNLDFAHRSLAARVLSPGRDVGVMAHGRLFDRRLSYQAGYFTRDGDNGRTSQTQGGKDAFAARIVVMPFATLAGRALAPLEIGVATVESQIDNRLGLRGRTVLGDGIFFDRLYVNGQRRRIGLDTGWERGPASVSAEYIAVSDERNAMGFGGGDLPSVDSRAWYVAATWALTGERKHGRLEPRHDLLRGGIGAVELTGRVEELRFEAASYPGSEFGFPTAGALSTNADRAITVGVNWYLNHYVKIVGNLVTEWIDDPARSPAPASGGRFVSPVLLLQFHF
jgi:phosphate-selective porin OprO/OprP